MEILLKLTDSIESCRVALLENRIVYVKNAMGDWIKVQSIGSNGDSVVADDLSGFNSGIIGQTMSFGHPNIDLRIKDFEIQ